MRYNIELSGERLKQERESIKCIVSRDENDKKIIALAEDDNPDASEMTQANLLAYMRQQGMDTIGRNKLSALENGDHDAFYNMTLSQWSAFCDVFGVSFEYLTGQEPYKTPTIKALCKITGLSAPAAGLLQTWNQDKPRYTEILSDILTSKEFSQIMNQFFLLYCQATAIKTGKETGWTQTAQELNQNIQKWRNKNGMEKDYRDDFLKDYIPSAQIRSGILALLDDERIGDVIRNISFDISRLSGNLAESYYQSKAGD